MDGAGQVWFGTTGGVSATDGIAWSDLWLTRGPACNYVNAAIRDTRGDLWLATDSGVTRVSRSGTTLSWRSFGQQAGLPHAWVRGLASEVGDRIWAATAAGVGKFDGTQWSAFTVTDGLVSNDVLAVAVDSSRYKWFGTNGSGVSRLDDKGTASRGDDVWTTFTTTHGLAGDLVTAVAAAADGSVWFGTLGSGVSRLQNGTWSNFNVTNGLPNNYVTRIAVNGAGEVWVGTVDGVGRFNGGIWTTYGVGDGLLGSDVVAFGFDAKGRVYFGTLYNGLHRLDDRGTLAKADDWWTNFTPTNPVLWRQVRGLLVDGDDNVWLGTYGGGLNVMNIRPMRFFPVIRKGS
jgi:ligand-binding sensor domain-containing protein